jgi:hypothetical protein
MTASPELMHGRVARRRRWAGHRGSPVLRQECLVHRRLVVYLADFHASPEMTRGSFGTLLGQGSVSWSEYFDVTSRPSGVGQPNIAGKKAHA